MPSYLPAYGQPGSNRSGNRWRSWCQISQDIGHAHQLGNNHQTDPTIGYPVIKPPRIIGIDDWAFRKGRNYGTIIIDHELGKPIDLLPSSAGKDLKEWLKKYPSIEMVTRDRSGEYRDAITEALPGATQIADRWHLLKNMETIERHISKRYKSLRESMANWAKEDAVDLDTENGENVGAMHPSQSGKQYTRRVAKRAKLCTMP